MPTVATIPYPMTNGARQSFVSIEVKLNGQIFVGIPKIDYKRTRERTVITGTNADPLGKTRGENKYEGSCDIYLAEFNQFMVSTMGGAGYGDVFFNVDVTYSENGLDVIHDTLIGCTIDSTEASNSKGSEGSLRTVNLSPLKVLFNGIDDNSSPLQGVQS
jgi:hypothetical protein